MIRIKSRPVKIINTYWYSNVDVARAHPSKIPIKMYPTSGDKDPIRIWNDILVVGCLTQEGPKKINFSREATRNQESGAFLKQSLPARDRAALVLLLICRRRNETSRGNGESGLRTGEACARYRANNTRRRRGFSLHLRSARDPRNLSFASNLPFDALVDAIDSYDQTKGFVTLSDKIVQISHNVAKGKLNGGKVSLD